MAGAQLAGIDGDKAYELLIAAIDSYFEENSRK